MDVGFTVIIASKSSCNFFVLSPVVSNKLNSFSKFISEERLFDSAFSFNALSIAEFNLSTSDRDGVVDGIGSKVQAVEVVGTEFSSSMSNKSSSEFKFLEKSL